MEKLNLRYDFKSAPIVYAEYIGHLMRTPGVAKLYFVRSDSPVEGGGNRQQEAALQLIMPTEGIVNAAIFLEAVVKDMVAEGMITEGYVDEMRAQLEAASGNEESR